MSRSRWAGRRVLLTGHTGFKGSWLSLWLRRAGAVVTGYALAPPPGPSLFGSAGVAGDLRSIEGDVRDLPALRAAVAEAEPEVVLHLAAQSLVRPSYEAPVETFATNVMGTAHVLEAARLAPSVRAVVVVTSDKCYENREWLWGYREGEPMGGHDPYSASKGCAELVTASYRASFCEGARALAVASARAGNVVGGGDWSVDRLVPDAMRAFSRGEPLVMRSPRSVRPWQHVLEPLAGYLRLAEALLEDGPAHASAWNFGPDEQGTATVEELIAGLAAQWGEGATWRVAEDASLHEARLLKLDSSKARALLRWRPRLTLAETLAWTSEWYRRCARGEDARAVTLEQIDRFEGLCA